MSRVIVHRSEWVHSSQSKNKTQAEEQGKRKKSGPTARCPQNSRVPSLFPFAFLLFTFSRLIGVE
jgi:hypothetical protein